MSLDAKFHLQQTTLMFLHRIFGPKQRKVNITLKIKRIQNSRAG